MLQNAPFLAIRGLDTAENEPSKVSLKWGYRTGVAPVMHLSKTILTSFEMLVSFEHSAPQVVANVAKKGGEQVWGHVVANIVLVEVRA